MGEILAIASQKGGVGKTTTAVNLGASFARLGYRTLLVDMDPQGSIATSFGYGRYDMRAGILELFTKNQPIEDCIHPTDMELFHFIPANIWSDEIDKSSLFGTADSHILKKALAIVKEHYDFIVIDCPPSLGNLTNNALTAADSLVVPIQCEYYALKALGRFLKMTRRVKENLNQELRYRGFLLTMVDTRNNLSRRVINKVRHTLKGLVFDTIIPRNVRLAEVPYYGRPAIMIDSYSKGAKSYMELAREILKQDKELDHEEKPDMVAA